MAELPTIEQVTAIHDELTVIRDRFDELLGTPDHLDDEQRERLRERLTAMPDAKLIGMLLAIHKIVEQTALGRLRGLIERESTVLTTVLDRFALEPFNDALAVWSEHATEEAETDA